MERRFKIEKFPKGFAVYDKKQKDYIIQAEFIEDDKLICLKKGKVKKIASSISCGTKNIIGDGYLYYIFEINNIIK